MVPGLLSIALSLVGFASSLLILDAARRLYRVESLLGREHAPSTGLALLGLAQAAGALLPLAGGEPAYLLYLATAALYSAGVLVLHAPAPPRRAHAMVALPVAYSLVGDTSALILGLHAAAKSRGPARLLLALSALSFAVRAAGMILLPSMTGTTLLVAGELARSLSLAALGVVYAPRR